MIEEWKNEPDLVKFTYKGYRCEVKRHPTLKHLCGYVYFDINKPKQKNLIDEMGKKENVWNIDLDVHGGITWGPQYGETNCIGFDCAHWGDLAPGVLETYRDMTNMLIEIGEHDKAKEWHDLCSNSSVYKSRDVYRNVAFVKKELRKVVNQLIVLEDKDES